MKIRFKEKAPQAALADIKKALEGRKLGELVAFNLEKDDLTVTIQKMGKSVLEFTKNPASKGGDLEWDLTSEKIALTHKAFKGEVIDKITKIIQGVGGQVIS